MKTVVIRRLVACAAALALTVSFWCVDSAAAAGFVFAVEANVAFVSPGEYVTLTLTLLGSEDNALPPAALQAYVCFDDRLFALDVSSIAVLYEAGGLRASPLRFGSDAYNRIFVNHTGLGGADLRGRTALVSFRLLALQPGTGSIRLDAAELYSGGSVMPGTCREAVVEVRENAEPEVTVTPTVTPLPTVAPDSDGGDSVGNPGGGGGGSVDGGTLEGSKPVAEAEDESAAVENGDALVLDALGEGEQRVVLPIGLTESRDIVVRFNGVILRFPGFAMPEGLVVYGEDAVVDGCLASVEIRMTDQNDGDVKTDFWVSLPFAPDENADPDGYVLAYWDEAGVRHVLDGILVDADGVWMEGFASRSGVYGVLWMNPVPYSDVVRTDWYYEAVKGVHRMGLMRGSGNGSFAPGATLSRGMFVQVLANLEGIDTEAERESVFLDVAEDAWYATAVGWAAEAGLVNGAGGGYFAPGNTVTREQMAVMLYRYCLYKGWVVPEDAAPAYIDGDAVSGWAREAVEAVTVLGLMTGKPGGLFDPSGTATRAEAATLFVRFVAAQGSGTEVG